MKLVFVTDLHGGNAVFRKARHLVKVVAADVLLIGGDVSGKYLVPIVQEGLRFRVRVDRDIRRLETPDALLDFQNRVGAVGGYPIICSGEEADRLREDSDYREEVLKRERVSRLHRWLTDMKADIRVGRVLINFGNDDPFYLDAEFENVVGTSIIEDQRILLPGGFEIVSCGYANLTPWNCPRDCSEDELWPRLDAKLRDCDDLSRVLVNFHCPPRSSFLDRAPKLSSDLRPLIGVDGVDLVHVGSHAVRRAIEEYAPAAGLHGHIHEAYAKERLGRTICVNPGSSYHLGELRAAIVHLEGGRLNGIQLVRER